jgi:hypothetical protein
VLSRSQAACMKNLVAAVKSWCSHPLKEHSLDSFEKILEKSAVDYSGESVVNALPLIPGEIEPGLPQLGVAGIVEAVNVSDPLVASWLLSADQQLLPRDQWPPKVPKARMNCSRKDWHEVAKLLWDRNMVREIALSGVFSVDGVPVLNGAFAVEKKGKPGSGMKQVCRLIVNMSPSNAYQRMLQSDLGTLTPSTHWTSIYIHEGCVLLWSSDDQKGAYYVFLLPSCWDPFMTFAWPVPRSILGLKGEGVTYLACSVIPMGWLSAVSLFQHIHRRMGICKFPEGAGHDQESEWRRDRKIPISLC